MRAYKCDRCGNYYDTFRKYEGRKTCLSIFVKERWITADMCDRCARKLENWFTMFNIFKEVDNDEMDTKAEQEVPAYGGLEEAEEGEE